MPSVQRANLSRAFLSLCAFLLLSACDSQATQGGNGAGGGDAALSAPPAAPVSVAQPLVMPVDEYREFSGRFEATDTVDIRSRVSGYLTEIKFQEGAIVKKGDPLFVIDPRQIEAALRQRQADLKVAQSQTTAAVNDFKRAETLFKSGDVSESLLDQRRAVRDAALASVEAAKAGVASAQVDMVYTRIAAPITGRIGQAKVTTGNLVTPGQEVLGTIVSLDPIHFMFDIDEKAYVAYARQMSGASDDAARANPGIPVSVALTDETDYQHTGTVDFIDNTVSNATGTMRARAVLANPGLFLTPGMFGRVRIRTGGADQGILIPDEAIMIDQSRKYVYVVDDAGKVAARTIQAGSIDKGLRIIEKGLTGNEWVIVNGLQRAQEGGTVSPQKTELKPRDGNAVLPNDPNAPVDAAAPIEDAPLEAAPTDAQAAPEAAQETTQPETTQQGAETESAQ